MEEANAYANPNHATSLATVLEEIWEFYKDSKQLLNDIKLEISTVIQNIIRDFEDQVQNMELIIHKMIKVINQHENKLHDQESRSQWKNFGLYNVPQWAEGLSTISFDEKLPWYNVNIPQAADWTIERECIGRCPWNPPGDEED